MEEFWFVLVLDFVCVGVNCDCCLVLIVVIYDVKFDLWECV